MGTFLFDSIIFGPVKSRRLGASLGINLLPNDCKICNFNCIYCECGLTSNSFSDTIKFHSREEIYSALEDKLSKMKNNNHPLTTITYAGNGEPTLHPDFADIIDDTIFLRNKYFPNIEIAVLSNAYLLESQIIFEALNKIEKTILKIDSGIEETCILLNQPKGNFSLQKVIDNLMKLKGNFILQTLFIQGKYKGKTVDNTTEKEINAWLKVVKKLHPKEVMIYTIERDTPFPDLYKVSTEKLNEISNKVRNLGINTQISY